MPPALSNDNRSHSATLSAGAVFGFGTQTRTSLKTTGLIGFALLAVACFHLAHWRSELSFCIAGYLAGLFVLRRANSARKAFYSGMAVGFGGYAPQLGFFWSLFGPAAIALWGVLSFWLGLFVLLARSCHRRWPGWRGVCLVPFLWLGFEYFRSELYYLRFSWLNAGFALAHLENLPHLAWLGVYGVGFVLMSGICLISCLPKKSALAASLGGLAGLVLLSNGPRLDLRLAPLTGRPVFVAGVQLEFPTEEEVLSALDALRAKFPEAELFVLSEYAFPNGPVPGQVKEWCRFHARHLIAGGKRRRDDGAFYNTAFVVGPSGEIVFEQAKAVPIQFFDDGLPAPAQSVWASPWGKIGLGICYDLSYRRVMDELVRQGAQALIIPTMDLREWGRHEHELHARVAPMRSAEYGLPIFRLASSGVSQLIEPQQRLSVSAPYPGEGDMLGGRLWLGTTGRLPLDRYLAPIALAVTGGIILCVLSGRRKDRPSARPHDRTELSPAPSTRSR